MGKDIFNYHKNLISEAIGTCSQKIVLISDKNNMVYNVQTEDKEVIAKFYTSKSPHSCENAILRMLPSSCYIYLADLLYFNKHNSLAIFDKQEGYTLLEIIERRDFDDEIYQTITIGLCDFLENSFSSKPQGFGYLNSDGFAQHKSWMDFLYYYQERITNTLISHPDLKEYCHLLNELLSSFRDELNVTEGCITPLDLNLSNLLINNDKCLKFIDLGCFISGNKLFSYGDWCCHTYGTVLFENIMSVKSFSVQEEVVIRIFAILSCLHILAAKARSGHNNLLYCKPWGNPQTFIEQINEHVRFLNI